MPKFFRDPLRYPNVLGLHELDSEVLADVRTSPEYPPDWDDYDELERVTEEWISTYRSKRKRVANERGANWSIRDAVDRLATTDRDEYLDRPDVSEEEKLKLVSELNEINRILGSYDTFAEILSYVADDMKEDESETVRILELASGYGEFAIYLARNGFNDRSVEVTGSDIVPKYVSQANERAETEGANVSFVELDALSIDDDDRSELGTYDVVFIAQSVHHFEPGQIARIVAGSESISDGFVAIDARRRMRMFSSFVPFAALKSRDSMFVHDAFVTGLRLYSETELRLITEIASPDAEITTGSYPPGFTVLDVRFDN